MNWHVRGLSEGSAHGTEPRRMALKSTLLGKGRIVRAVQIACAWALRLYYDCSEFDNHESLLSITDGSDHLPLRAAKKCATRASSVNVGLHLSARLKVWLGIGTMQLRKYLDV